MDTGTHVLMGFALGGLATFDPAIANDPTLAHAVLIGTLVGSQAPDIDTVFKLKNKREIYSQSSWHDAFDPRFVHLDVAH
ncbi:hypothetical protein LR68_01771 [Anoxybacillus sp. BCO1]|nr:hypothetical protein LR68_01771 [Anoxybacillus sp. BCO1]